MKQRLMNEKVRAYMMSLPGKRGHDIPADIYDRMLPAAQGVTLPMWGRNPTPEQMQHLYDSGMHEPEQIHDAFGDLDHPHAPGVKVSEYSTWKEAAQTWKQHAER